MAVDTLARAQSKPLRSGHASRRPWRRLLGLLGAHMFMIPAAAYLGVFMVYPVLFNIAASFQHLTAGNLLRGGSFIGLKNYAQVIGHGAIGRSALTTLLFGLVSCVFQLILGFALALFYNVPFPGAKTLRGLYLAVWTIPVLVWGSIFRWILDGDYGVLNAALQALGLQASPVYWLSQPGTAMFGVIAANVWRGIPFFLILILAGLQGIPDELYDAARTDGAGRWRLFTSITLPLVRPAALSAVILGLILNLKEFDVIWIMTQGGPLSATEVLSAYSYKLTFQSFRFGEGAASLNLLFLGIFILAVIYLRLVQREQREQDGGIR